MKLKYFKVEFKTGMPAIVISGTTRSSVARMMKQQYGPRAIASVTPVNKEGAMGFMHFSMKEGFSMLSGQNPFYADPANAINEADDGFLPSK